MNAVFLYLFVLFVDLFVMEVESKCLIVLTVRVSPARPRSPRCRAGGRWRWWRHPSARLSGRNRPPSAALRHRWNNNLSVPEQRLRGGDVNRKREGERTHLETAWSTPPGSAAGLHGYREPCRATTGWCTGPRPLRHPTEPPPGNTPRYSQSTHKVHTKDTRILDTHPENTSKAIISISYQ